MSIRSSSLGAPVLGYPRCQLTDGPADWQASVCSEQGARATGLAGLVVGLVDSDGLGAANPTNHQIVYHRVFFPLLCSSSLYANCGAMLIEGRPPMPSAEGTPP